MSSSSSTSKLVPHTNAGSRTVEGNVSGSRAAALEKQRQEQAQAFEAAKTKKAKEASQMTASLDKFRTATKQSAAEQAFSSQTVGLVTADEFVKASATKASAALKFLVTGDATGDAANDATTTKDNPDDETPEQRAAREKAERKARKKKRKEKTKRMATLSFADDGDDDENDDHPKNNTNPQQPLSNQKPRKKSKKDPTVDTSFLPDAQRDQERQEQKRALEQEWLKEQLLIKQQTLEITYSYWDGSGHRRELQCSKGDSIGAFLAAVINQLSKEFRNLAGLAADDLMYIKEDLIIPNDLTFYDLIATKARGKSGPLFHFDVHDDVRVGPLDVRVEKEESHPGKVVERKWYERHKHIFPASRWEVYDPSKDSYGAYTIGGK